VHEIQARPRVMTDVVSIVGDPPGCKCGMGDFVGVFHKELESRGYSTETVLIPNLRVWHLPRIRRHLIGLEPRIIHLQFPSATLGRDPSVAALPLIYRNAPWLITLCEYAALNPVRRLSLVPLLYTFDGYVLTTDKELDFASRHNPWLRSRARIVPAVSNIPLAIERSLLAAKVPNSVVYFGQVVPNRGLEQFLDLAELAMARGADFKFSIVGATPDWAKSFWQNALKRAAQAGCSMHLNLDDANVSRELARTAFGYFPYPDGASSKRGTLPAALEHEILLLTSWTAKTGDVVKRATIEARDPASALDRLTELQRRSDMRACVLAEVKRYNAGHSLKAVSGQYIAFYEQMLDGSRSRQRARSKRSQ
jgi:glycosyltransferase involved in cell wall biosynthesis